MNLLTCNYCHGAGFYYCGRCKVEGYCSQKCQKNDFPTHRFVCFGIPTLIPANGLKLNVASPSSDEDLPNMANLRLTQFEQDEPTVKLTKVEMIQKPTTVEKEVQKITHVAEKPESEAIKPKTAATPSASRQTLKEVEQPKAAPILQEQKEIEQPKAAPVRQAPKEIDQEIDPPLKLPAFKQGPRSIPPEEVQKPIKLPPSLPRNPMNKAPKPAEEKIPRIFFSDMKVRELQAGTHKVAIMNVDSDNKMLFVLETFDEAIGEYLSWIEDTTKEMVGLDKTMTYIPEKQEMILAKFEGEFYRGVHTGKTKQDLYEIYFVDYGNVSYCPSNEIKPFCKTLQMDIILHKVFVENMPSPMTKKAMTLFTGSAPITIEVSGKNEKGVYICKVEGI